MKISEYPILTIVLTVLMVSLTSCRKELCYDHYPSIDVTLSWEQEWERDYGMSHPTAWDPEYYGFKYSSLCPDIPESVTLIRYTPEGKTVENYLSNKGGKMEVDLKDSHSLLLYNSDTEFIMLSDIASATDARATTASRSRSSLSYMKSQYPGLRSITPPDALFSAYVEDIPYIDLHEVRHVPVKMQPLVYTYVIRYEFEAGLEYVALARGALAGMAESVYLKTGHTSDQSAIILFDCEMTSYGCEAHVKSFGVPGFPDKYYGQDKNREAPQTYMLNLEMKFNNGNTFEYNYDITDQLKNQPRGGVIVISGITVDKDKILHDSGFEVDISGWDDHEEIDLPVGPGEQ